MSISHEPSQTAGFGPHASVRPVFLRIQGLPQQILCPPGASILDAFERMQAALSPESRDVVPVGCRRGGCGICRVRILDGDYLAGPMSRAHVGNPEQDDGLVLACRAYPTGDLLLEAAPLCPRRLKGMNSQKQAFADEATSPRRF